MAGPSAIPLRNAALVIPLTWEMQENDSPDDFSTGFNNEDIE
jgi:hypothetical protein